MNLKQSFKACMDGVLPRVVEFLIDRVALPLMLALAAVVMVLCTVFVMTLVVVVAPFAPRHADTLFHKFMQEIGQ
ncbi:MAG: hypothetical protein ACRC8B_22690 [Aeromonas sobria]|uniref:hypothetical protein n=1 Tax=Aeromonas sobria TaxID=646 RepID=UPI003F2FD1DA